MSMSPASTRTFEFETSTSDSVHELPAGDQSASRIFAGARAGPRRNDDDASYGAPRIAAGVARAMAANVTGLATPFKRGLGDKFCMSRVGAQRGRNGPDQSHLESLWRTASSLTLRV